MILEGTVEISTVARLARKGGTPIAVPYPQHFVTLDNDKPKITEIEKRKAKTVSNETTTMYGMKTCWHIHHATGLNARYCQPVQTNDTDSETESDE